MTNSGAWPKVDGDIYYAYDTNKQIRLLDFETTIGSRLFTDNNGWSGSISPALTIGSNTWASGVIVNFSIEHAFSPAASANSRNQTAFLIIGSNNPPTQTSVETVANAVSTVNSVVTTAHANVYIASGTLDFTKVNYFQISCSGPQTGSVTSVMKGFQVFGF